MYLNCHSYYSLLYGTFSIEKLVGEASARNIKTLALTDINNSSGMVDFVTSCRKNGIKPVAGMEFRQNDKLLFVGLAQNIHGFSELNHYMTQINLGKTKMQETAPAFKNVFVIYPLENMPEILQENEFAGIRPSQAGKLLRTKLPPHKQVVLQPVTFEDKVHEYLHKNLRAMGHNLLLSHLKPGMYAPADEKFLSPAEIEQAFEAFPEVIGNSHKLLANCTIDFNFSQPKNKKTFTGSVSGDKKLLEKLAFEGLQYRYGNENSEAGKRLQNELNIIQKLGFSAYFLITHDIVRYAMQQGIYHVGRGSGANSITAYCLRITDVDPMELDLYFERFINAKRSSPPDFDLDFSWKERGKIQHYIFKRYGSEHVALLGSIVTFKKRSAYRELAKIHGLSKAETDKLVANPEAEAAGSSLYGHLHALAQKLMGFPHQRSIHAGGILVSEKPLSNYTALDLPPKGFPTTQWDMYVAETLGFEKLDILSQRGIGHIQEAVELIRKNTGTEIDIHQTERFKKDGKIKSMLKNGETNGCFYIESPAMRSLLKKLQCSDYRTLVAASSIIRPGVARSGMMREYIRRFHHPDGFKYLHPILKEQLSETYGVMVYQEDVLKVCHHFAGLDLADADVLRRAMSGKFRGKEEFQHIKDKFFHSSRKQGHAENIIREVWRQIESFAGYSFSKAHSASYAVESFQSLYLKAHFPLEFQVAVINNFGGFYSTQIYFNEARRQGGTVHLPCINRSDFKTNIRGKDIFIGFIHLSGLEKKTVNKLLSEREKNGRYESFEGFVRRAKPGIEQLILLIRAGAFRFTGKNKPELLWEAHLLTKTEKKRLPDETLFLTERQKFVMPLLKTDKLEDAYDETELLGFPVTLSLFDMLQTKFRGEVRAMEMLKHVGHEVRMLGLLVNIKYVRTKRKETMHFATFLDDRGEMFDTTHFPGISKQYPFRGNGIYLLKGKVTEEFGHAGLEVEKMAKMPLQPDPRDE